MFRARRFPAALLLAIASLLVVSLDGPLHHHGGPAAVDCAVCYAAAAPAVEAPSALAVAAPEAEASALDAAPAASADRLPESFAPARAPPAGSSLEA